MPLLRDLPAEVRALTGVAFMVALGFGLVAPALPLFAQEFGVGRAAAGAVVSVFALMRLVMAPFVGRLVNLAGERVLLAVGIGVVAVSSLLAGLAQSYWQLLVLRGAGGIGSIMFSVSAASLLVRVTPSHLRGRAQGVWAGSFLIGLVAGPAVGTVATFSLRLPFFLYAGTLVVAGLVGLGALRHSELAARQSVRSEPMALRAALRQRAYLAALGAGFAGDFALVGARSAMLPLYVRDSLHLSSGWVYAAFLIVSVVSGVLLLPTGKVADTIGRRPVIVVGLAVGAAAFLVLPAAPGAAGLLIATVLIGVAAASDSVAPGAVMGDVVAGRGGTVVAVFQMAGDLGAVLGPIVTGWIADAAGYSPAFVVCAVVCAVPIFAVLAAPETLRAHVPRAPAVAEGAARDAATDAT
ncbi:MAG TPA: MFS transporter [Nocardioides sp.]|uniref:MFS transporter n=1 Tax=Nocardioides sp. TaxID=35761 RepID=UPI002E341896|nr:MFS transporter [Nocardioides sp.]HEX3932578.1 MFS transporter [Nocardioides sp.]